MALKIAVLPGDGTGPEVVREAFSRTSVRDVRQWVRDKLGITFASMRRSAYKEAEPPTGATKSPQPT